LDLIVTDENDLLQNLSSYDIKIEKVTKSKRCKPTQDNELYSNEESEPHTAKTLKTKNEKDTDRKERKSTSRHKKGEETPPSIQSPPMSPKISKKEN